MIDLTRNKWVDTGYNKQISDDEVQQIFRYLEERGEWTYLMIFKIMAYMGLRISEVLNLKWHDIIGNYQTLRVELIKQGHKIKERIIPKILQDDLKDYISYKKQFARKDNFYIFQPSPISNSRSSHIKPATVRWKIREIREALGLKDCYYTTKNGNKLQRITNHTFRHYFMTLIYEKSGFDIMACKQIIGHKKIDTTMRYINPISRESEIVNSI